MDETIFTMPARRFFALGRAREKWRDKLRRENKFKNVSILIYGHLPVQHSEGTRTTTQTKKSTCKCTYLYFACDARWFLNPKSSARMCASQPSRLMYIEQINMFLGANVRARRFSSIIICVCVLRFKMRYLLAFTPKNFIQFCIFVCENAGWLVGWCLTAKCNTCNINNTKQLQNRQRRSKYIEDVHSQPAEPI